MYIYGGVTRQLQVLDDVIEYDFIQNRWAYIDCMGEIPPGRFAHASCVVDHSFYIFGGSDYFYVFNNCHFLDLRQWRWQRLPRFPVCRYFHNAVYASHQIYVFGGKIKTPESRSNKLWVCPLPETNKDILKEDMKRFFESKKLFNTLSDIQFVSTNGDVFHAHSIILKSRCPHIPLEVYETLSSQSLYSFLYYLYTDEIPESEPSELFDIFKLYSQLTTNKYKYLPIRRYISLIESSMRHHMTYEKAHELYKKDTKQFTDEFVSYLKLYLLLQRPRSDLFRIHPQPLLSFTSTYTQDLSHILWNQPTDMRIGQVKCHSVILAIRTKLFSCDTFLHQYMNTEMICDFLTPQALKALIDYIYQGKDSLLFTRRHIRREWKEKDIVHYFGLSSEEVYSS
jgi:hypothetical protein